MATFRIAFVAMFVLVVPASAASKDCVTYSSSFWESDFDFLKKNTVECLVVKGKHRARRVYRHSPHVKQVSYRHVIPAHASGGNKEDVWKAVHGAATEDTTETLWRQFNEWLKNQPVR